MSKILVPAVLLVFVAAASAGEVKYDVTCKMGTGYDGYFKGNIYLMVKTKRFLVSTSQEVAMDQEEKQLGYMPMGHDLNCGKEIHYEDVPFQGTLDKIKSVQVKWYNTLGDSRPAQVQRCVLTEKETKKSQAYCL